jgi:hypothetical protein
VPEPFGDALWETHLRRATLKNLLPEAPWGWGEFRERVAHALGIKNERWGTVAAIDGRLGLRGVLIAQGEQAGFSINAWWDQFLLGLLVRSVIRVSLSDPLPLVLIAYDDLALRKEPASNNSF